MLIMSASSVVMLGKRGMPDKEPPSKNSDSTQFFQPMIDMMLASIASFAPTQQSSAASQNLIKLETELEKR